jgi:hypothetical protein
MKNKETEPILYCNFDVQNTDGLKENCDNEAMPIPPKYTLPNSSKIKSTKVLCKICRNKRQV